MQLEGVWRRRPASVWMLALLDLVGALLCTFGALAPPTPRSPAALNALAAAVAYVVVALLWWRGRDRTPWVLVHVNLVVYVTAACALVGSAATGEGALSAAFSVLLLSMYLGIVVPRQVLRLYLVALVVGLAGALALSDTLSFSLAVWLPPALSVVAAGEVLSWLTTNLRTVGITDQLTGVLNRNGFAAAAARAATETSRSGVPLTLAVVDLDDFKQVNDRGGHAAGDLLLSALADQWRAELRDDDEVCRLGGDEFVFILPDTDEAEARQVLRRIRASSCGAWSFGLARYRPGETIESCVARADEQLYVAKAVTSA